MTHPSYSLFVLNMNVKYPGGKTFHFNLLTPLPSEIQGYALFFIKFLFIKIMKSCNAA